MTSPAGLPVYLDLAPILDPGESISTHLHVKVQGWSDEQVVLSLILLNLAGGESVDDLRILEADDGFCRILRHVELKGVKRKERRETEKRWRKEKHGSVPSPSAVFRYLAAFHAVIPPLTDLLCGLECIIVAAVQKRNPIDTATLDMDAALIETQKKEALLSYQGYKACQPLNTYWAEAGLILHTEVQGRQRSCRS